MWHKTARHICFSSMGVENRFVLRAGLAASAAVTLLAAGFLSAGQWANEPSSFQSPPAALVRTFVGVAGGVKVGARSIVATSIPGPGSSIGRSYEGHRMTRYGELILGFVSWGSGLPGI